MAAAYPDKRVERLEMVVIDGHVWQRGPDKLWYRLESSEDPVGDDN